MVRGLEHMASDESLREYCTFDLPSSVEQFSRGQWPQVLAWELDRKFGKYSF